MWLIAQLPDCLLFAQINAGAIGDVRTIHITSRDPAPPPVAYLQNSGGIFMDMTSHDFDMARFLVSDPKLPHTFSNFAPLREVSLHRRLALCHFIVQLVIAGMRTKRNTEREGRGGGKKPL